MLTEVLFTGEEIKVYIFISYAKEGIKYAKLLNKILSDDGHETFLFEHHNTFGEEIYLQIGRALSKCRIAAIIITKSSHESEEQKLEYSSACSSKKARGLIKEGEEFGEFTLLRAWQYIEFNDSNIDEKMGGFLDSINRLQNIPESKATAKREGEKI